jgi:hypothetical protein
MTGTKFLAIHNEVSEKVPQIFITGIGDNMTRPINDDNSSMAKNTAYLLWSAEGITTFNKVGIWFRCLFLLQQDRKWCCTQTVMSPQSYIS